MKKKIIYHPSKGDICYLDLHPQKGREQAKRRPVLIISDGRFNKKIGLALVCPITSTPPRHGFHLKLPSSLLTSGTIMTEQIKSLDYQARRCEFIEQTPDRIIIQVSEIIKQIVS